MRWRVPVLLLALLAPVAAPAQEDADALLRGLGLAPAAEIVSVQTGRRADGLVVVTLTPSGDTKLVADPGVTVVPVDAAGLAVAEPVSLSDLAQEYFTEPPSLKVQPGAATGLRTEYAYCVVSKQCLFGDTTVPVPASASSLPSGS